MVCPTSILTEEFVNGSPIFSENHFYTIIWTQLYNLELQKIEIVEDILKESALAGKGQSFLEAAGTNANAAFLAAMAMVESGGGTSKLAIGNVQNYKGWYNLYGIGAYDGPTAATNAAKFAKDHGWNTVEKAIVGGGKFIVEKYIKTGRGSVNNFVLLT